MFSAIMLFLTLLLIGGSLMGIYWGLSKIFGGGWAMIILDLITKSTNGGYETAQHALPPSRDNNGKIVGLIVITVCVSLIVFLVTR